MKKLSSLQLQDIAKKEIDSISIHSGNVNWEFDRLVDIDRILDENQVSVSQSLRLKAECEILLKEKKMAYFELLDEGVELKS